MIPDEEFCYLTTTGRTSGRPHTIEIWYVGIGDTVWMISGGMDRSDWVRNLQADPAVSIRIGDRTWTGRARVGPPDDGDARRALAARYQGWQEGQALSSWATGGLTIAVDVDA